MKFTITGYSTALFATWYVVEEAGVLFDCGDGLMAALLQKSRKIEHVFITHPDRDHLAGLFQFNQLNARNGFPIIYYPKDSGSFPALAAFSAKFDPHVAGTVWKPIAGGEKIWVKKDLYVQAIRNNHIAAPQDVYKSLGYKMVQVKQKLKPEFVDLPPLEIKKAIETWGKEHTYTTVETTLLAYSGDTPVENFEHWDGAQTLIHEATFLNEEDGANPVKNKHSRLDAVIEAAAGIRLGQLVLGHFSSRYSNEEIDAHIGAACQKYGVTFPVHRVLPGQVVRDILKESAVIL